MKIIGNGVIGIRRGRKCKILNIKTIWKLTPFNIALWIKKTDK